MAINAGMLLIRLVLALALSGIWPMIAWAVPANYQAVMDLKKIEEPKGEPTVAINVPQVKYSSDGLRDPFKQEAVKKDDQVKLPPDQSQATLPINLNVQGLIWGGSFPQAIVNNRVVKIGDLIEGVRIVNISKEGVTIFREGHEQVISSPAAEMLLNNSPNSKGGGNETQD